MNRAILSIATMAFLSVCFAGFLAAGDDASDAAKSNDAAKAAKKYTLRYKFQSGETLRWNVEHRTRITATYGNSTQSSEMESASNKAWRVVDVKPDGEATIEHRVEWIDMRQRLSGAKDVHFDSRTGEKPPHGYEDAAKSVGALLATMRLDATGKVLSIKRNCLDPKKQMSPQHGSQDDYWMTVPLPAEPIAIGHTWSVPQNIEVPVDRSAIRKIRAVQRFELEDVKTGVATIRISTDVLTPITDPLVESQLVQREVAGRVRFDIDEGRIISQQMNIDKSVIGFRGDASQMHYVNNFSERLQSEALKTAEKGK